MTDSRPLFTREQIAEYAHRDWENSSQSKMAYWAARFNEDWRITWDAAQSLYLQATQVRRPFLSAVDRATDLESHVALRRQFDRLSHAFTRR